jgi:AcrR family transcriptional regulator
VSGILPQLLDAALGLYLERGIHDTTLSAVAQRAGVSRPTVYKHLGDADAIADAVIERELAHFFAALVEVLAAQRPARERLVECVAFAVEYARSHPLVRRQLELEPGVILPVFTVEAQAVLHRAVDLIEPLVVTGIEERTLPDRDPRMQAEAAARLAISLVFSPSVTVELDDPVQLRRFVSVALPSAH